VSAQNEAEEVAKIIIAILIGIFGIWLILALFLSVSLNDITPSDEQVQNCFDNLVTENNRDSETYIEAMYRTCNEIETVTATERGMKYSGVVIALFVFCSIAWIVFSGLDILMGDKETRKQKKLIYQKRKSFLDFLERTWKTSSSELTSGAENLKEELRMIKSFRDQYSTPGLDWDKSYSMYYNFKVYLQKIRDRGVVKKSEVVKIQSMLKDSSSWYRFFYTDEIMDNLDWVIAQLEIIYEKDSSILKERREKILKYKSDIKEHLIKEKKATR